MGHVEPGGPAGGAADAGGKDRLWELWFRLRRFFPSWSFGVTGMRSRVYWGLWGNDLVSELRRSRPARQAADLLAGTHRPLLDALRELAEVNVRRQEQMFRFIALGYLTLPLGATALAADVAPDFLQEIYAESPSAIWIVVLSFAIGVYIAFMGLWRARQMLTVLEMLILERGLAEAGDR